MKLSAFSAFLALSICLSAVLVHDVSAEDLEQAVFEEEPMDVIYEEDEVRHLRSVEANEEAEPEMMDPPSDQDERNLGGYGGYRGGGGYYRGGGGYYRGGGGYYGGYGGGVRYPSYSYGGGGHYGGGYNKGYSYSYRQPVVVQQQPVFFRYGGCGGKMGCGKMGYRRRRD